MKKKFSLSKTLAIIVAISPLFMSLFCDLHYSLFIEILKGEGTTNPPPGYYELDENDSAFSVTVTPAQGWRIETLTVQSGESYGHLEQSQPSPLKLTDTEKLLYTVSGRPNDEDEQATEIKVAFEKIPDPSTTTTTTTTTTLAVGTVNLELLAVTRTDYDQSGINASSFGDYVSCYANPPYTFATGSTMKLSANPDPKPGYKFEKWEIYVKDSNGVFQKTTTSFVAPDDGEDVEPTIRLNGDTKAVAIYNAI